MRNLKRRVRHDPNTRLVRGSVKLGDGLAYFADNFKLSRSVAEAATAFQNGLPVTFETAYRASRSLDALYREGLDDLSQHALWDTQTRIRPIRGRGLDRSDYHVLGQLRDRLIGAMIASE